MPMKTRTGWEIVAVVKSYEGSDPEIEIKDNSLQVIRSADGDLCICKKAKQKYWVPEEEQHG